MILEVDVTSPVPPFEQIRQQIAARIAEGSLPTGTRLPTIRQLAADLHLAPGTVARAYAELEAARLVETNRSRGTRVRGSNATGEPLRLAADAFVGAARDAGLDAAEAVALIRARFSAGA